MADPAASPAAAPVRLTVTTAPAPGAIALIQLHGPGARQLASRFTGRSVDQRSRLVEFAGIDHGLAVALREDWAELMPHGGLRVVQTIVEALRQLGAAVDEAADPRELFPEAATDLEADVLAALAGAASPAAIDWLLAQPRRWTEAMARSEPDWAAIAGQSRRLDRLLVPPTLVVVGRANVGKSTLSNLVMGRAASITADLPGTTRDWVAGLAELNAPIGPIAVRWFDTPGLRQSEDAIERRAIELARQVFDAADLLIAVRDPELDFPDPGALPRTPDLWLFNKADRLPAMPADPGVLAISALHGTGLDELAAAIGRRLGLEALAPQTPWAFSDRLKALVSRGSHRELTAYAGL